MEARLAGSPGIRAPACGNGRAAPGPGRLAVAVSRLLAGQTRGRPASRAPSARPCGAATPSPSACQGVPPMMGAFHAGDPAPNPGGCSPLSWSRRKTRRGACSTPLDGGGRSKGPCAWAKVTGGWSGVASPVGSGGRWSASLWPFWSRWGDLARCGRSDLTCWVPPHRAAGTPGNVPALSLPCPSGLALDDLPPRSPGLRPSLGKSGVFMQPPASAQTYISQTIRRSGSSVPRAAWDARSATTRDFAPQSAQTPPRASCTSAPSRVAPPR